LKKLKIRLGCEGKLGNDNDQAGGDYQRLEKLGVIRQEA
jgi:hypothetical protein